MKLMPARQGKKLFAQLPSNCPRGKVAVSRTACLAAGAEATPTKSAGQRDDDVKFEATHGIDSRTRERDGQPPPLFVDVLA
jgi:hypothetical protein